jgi:hypothetical protein
MLGEGCKQLALLLVEVISPDIMYNGLPWPEDEFMKVRDEVLKGRSHQIFDLWFFRQTVPPWAP